MDVAAREREKVRTGHRCAGDTYIECAVRVRDDERMFGRRAEDRRVEPSE